MIIVFSLGGSVIIPNKVDLNYLEKFKDLILKIKKKHKIIIVTGGGRTARTYINALEKEGLGKKTLSYIGIFTTRLNARLVASLLGIKKIPSTEKELKNMAKREKLIVTGALGFHPNMTSDGTAAEAAMNLKAELFVNITNVDGLYDKDPKRFRNAKLIKNITFKKFYDISRKTKFIPGQHFVLDQTASRIIYNNKIKTAIVNKNIKNIRYFSKGKRGFIFIGNYKGKKIAIKAKNPKSDAILRIENEIKFLKILNKKNIGPKLLFHEKDFLVYEFADGVTFTEFLKSKKADKKRVLKAIKNIFGQLFEMDKLNINKEEMSHPVKHIIISNKNKPVLLDFERSHYVKNPGNVTQFCDFLVSSNMINTLKSNKIDINKNDIINAAKIYKHRQNKNSFNNIVNQIK
jgi:uridylate kinase